jgi:hypothetical protein
MKVLTPHDDVVDASEVEHPEDLPKIAFIGTVPAIFSICSGGEVPHWDNPNMAPFGEYEIQTPGAGA